jgi:dTDP-glucose 4,6-dehydratase
MNNVMITGCAGFIGSHAVDYFLEKGYNVTGVDCFTYAGKSGNILHQNNHSSFDLFNLDICSTSSIKEVCSMRSIEWIINFAAETHVDNSIKSSSSFIHSNVEGVRSLLEVCKDSSTKLLHISTDEVYGSIESGDFFEYSKLDPRNPYSATKAAAEHLVTAYNNTYNTQFIIVRPSNNFGPRQHYEKFLPTIIRSIMRDKKVPIYGDGLNIREWLFVRDNVAAIEFILRNSKINETYNISSKNEMTNVDIVKSVCSLLAKNYDDSAEFVKDRPGHDYRYSVSNKKLVNLDFDGFTDFNKNLKTTIEWYLGEK